MEKRTLVGEMRKEFTKGYTKDLRRNGKIPAVIYGNVDPLSVCINEHEFNTKFKVISENIIIQLKVDGNIHDVLVKDYQEDILTGKIFHLDFYEIQKGKLLKTRVPVHTHGAPVGVKDGGIFEVHVHEIEIECLPKDLPEEIVIDVTNLALTHSIHIKDIPVSEGTKVLNPPDQVVCIVTRKREVKETVVEEAAEEEKTEEAAATADKKEE